VPTDLISKAKGRSIIITINGDEYPVKLGNTVKLSLRTKEPKLAKERFSEAAAIACDKPTERKVFIEISAGRRAALAAFEAVLNLLVRPKADQAFVVTLPNAETPSVGFDVS
jgi:hypothetical protein